MNPANWDPRWTVAPAAVGWLAAVVVLAIAYLPHSGRSFSPCQDPDFTDPIGVRSYGTVKEDRLWPPGSVCRAYTPDGRFLREESYPKGRDWLIALAAFLTPVALVALYRRSPWAPSSCETRSRSG